MQMFVLTVHAHEFDDIYIQLNNSVEPFIFSVELSFLVTHGLCVFVYIMYMVSWRGVC